MGKGNRVKENKYLEQANIPNHKIKKTKTDSMTKIISIVMAFILIGSLALIFVNQSGLLIRSATVTKTENYRVNAAMMSYYVYSQYQNFFSNSYINQYVSMGYIKLNPQYSLKSQQYDTGFNSLAPSLGYPTMESGTWLDYFALIAKESIAQSLILAELAIKNGLDLDDEDKINIDTNIDSLKDAAKTSGYSLSKYITLNYGEGVNKSDIRDCLELSTIAAKFYEKKTEEIKTAITEGKIDEYFAENPDLFYTAEYLSYTFTATHPATDVETATEEENQKYATLKADMLALATELEGKTTEKQFKEYVYNYVFSLAFDESYAVEKDELTVENRPTDTDLATLKAAMLIKLTADYTKTEQEKEEALENEETTPETTTAETPNTSTVEAVMAKVEETVKEKLSTDLGDLLKTGSHPKLTDYEKVSADLEWIYGIGDGVDPADKGSVKKFDNENLIESEKATSHTYTVYYIIEKSDYDQELSKNVAHILIKPADYTEEGETTNGDGKYPVANDKAKAEAQRILDIYLSGAKTQAEFEKLGEEYTTDSSVLYENVIRGQMVAEFEAWIFGEAKNDSGVVVDRIAGDTGIVETDYGFHIMYFVGDGNPTWKVNAENNIFSDDYNAWYETQRASFELTFNEKAISKIN